MRRTARAMYGTTRTFYDRERAVFFGRYSQNQSNDTKSKAVIIILIKPVSARALFIRSLWQAIFQLFWCMEYLSKR